MAKYTMEHRNGMCGEQMNIRSSTAILKGVKDILMFKISKGMRKCY